MRTNFKDPIMIEWLREFVQKKKMEDVDKYRQFYFDNIKEFVNSSRTDLMIILLLVFYKINLENNKLKQIDL